MSKLVPDSAVSAATSSPPLPPYPLQTGDAAAAPSVARADAPSAMAEVAPAVADEMVAPHVPHAAGEPWVFAQALLLGGTFYALLDLALRCGVALQTLAPAADWASFGADALLPLLMIICVFALSRVRALELGEARRTRTSNAVLLSWGFLAGGCLYEGVQIAAHAAMLFTAPTTAARRNEAAMIVSAVLLAVFLSAAVAAAWQRKPVWIHAIGTSVCMGALTTHVLEGAGTLY